MYYLCDLRNFTCPPEDLVISFVKMMPIMNIPPGVVVISQ